MQRSHIGGFCTCCGNPVNIAHAEKQCSSQGHFLTDGEDGLAWYTALNEILQRLGLKTFNTKEARGVRKRCHLLTDFERRW